MSRHTLRSFLRAWKARSWAECLQVIEWDERALVLEQQGSDHPHFQVGIN